MPYFLELPSSVPVCQVCGTPINPANEPGGKLHLIKGRPMCAVHRLLLLRSSTSKLDYRKVFAQKAEQEKAELDVLVANEFKTQREKNRVEAVAADSQEAADQLIKH